MSKYSVKVGDRFENLIFRRHKRPPGERHGYELYIGDQRWGTIFDMGGYWTAVANCPGKLNLVEGFKRRMDAAWYIVSYVKAHSQ